MKYAKYKYLAGHQILDLKKLTDERNESFQYNKPKTTLFSKCRTIFVSSKSPTYMMLSYLNPETMETDNETVPLADKEWAISKYSSPEQFQVHYLQKNGFTGDQIIEMMETLMLGKDKALELIPKKLKYGIYYKLSAKKLKDLASLESTMTVNQGKWIRKLLQRQGREDCTIVKKPPIDNDPKFITTKTMP